MKDENGNICDIGEVSPVKSVIEREEVICCEDHRTDESGPENQPIMICELKYKTKNGNDDRADEV